MHIESFPLLYAALTVLFLFVFRFLLWEYIPIKRSFGGIYDSTGPLVRRVLLRYLLMGTFVVGILLASSGPYIVGSKSTAATSTFELVLLVDKSISMTSRLERAKVLARGIVHKFPQANIAVCGFTAGAFCRAPLDSSIDSILRTIDTLAIDAITGSGSNINEALNSMSREFNLQGEEGRLLVLLSDGGDVTGAYYRLELNGVLENLSDQRIHVVAVGIGEGTPIPVARDQQNKIIFSSLNEEKMKHIAERTGGLYVHETTLTEQNFSLPTSLLSEAGVLRPTTTGIDWIPALAAYASIVFYLYLFGKNP